MGLSLPRALKGDPNAIEVLRIWLGESGIHCSIDLGLGREQAEESEWGLFLAQVIRRVGRLIEEQGGMEADAVVTDIVDALLEEISRSTSDPEDDHQ
jgi:hypothetical protein